MHESPKVTVVSYEGGVCVINETNNSKEGDDTMAAISKPVSGAFVLSEHKAKEFLTKKVSTSSDAIRRFENRKSAVNKVASKKSK